MKEIIEVKASRRATTWFALSACLGLLLGFIFTAMAESGTFSKMAAGAREVRSLVSWYAQSGQWRIDAKAYRTHAEFLFCPNSRTIPSMDEDEDEE